MRRVNTRKYLLLAILVGFNLGLGLMMLTAAERREPAVPADGKTATVPFEILSSNHMIVRAKLNDKGPYRLVFDLGAPITLLSNRAAESSGAIEKGAPKSFLFAMRGEGKVRSLSVGDLKAEDLPVIVFDHPALKALGGFFTGPLDGIIGFTFFARYKTTIDYKAKEMTFTPVEYRVRDLMKDLPERLSGPKTARERVLSPTSLWGLNVGEPAEGSPGAPITRVVPGSPAAEAGLRAGDVLTTLDGRWTTNAADAHAAASGTVAGKEVEVVVLRDGKEVTLKVTPKEGI